MSDPTATGSVSADGTAAAQIMAQDIAALRAEVAALKASVELLVHAAVRTPTFVDQGRMAIFKLLDYNGWSICIPTSEIGLFGAARSGALGLVERGLQLRILGALQPGMTAIDVGANVGVHTLAMAYAVGQDGRVWAFEPASHVAAALRSSMVINGYRQTVQVVQAAVTDRAGKIEFHQAHTATESSLYLPTAAATSSSVVDTVALDDIVPAGRRVDLVKIDAEGAEPLVLKGMSRILGENPGLVLISEFAPIMFERSRSDATAYLAGLRALGFDLHRVEEPTGRLLPVTDAELLSSYSVNLLARRGSAAS